ncbi:hypothetical protein BC828DRAFT_380204 [Blastocladiella britannica]|nr:hypothetical protein BC828DRAFT_380204 [Blastocladiella britannica]
MSSGRRVQGFAVPPHSSPLISDGDAYATLATMALGILCAIVLLLPLTIGAASHAFTPPESPLRYMKLRCRYLLVADLLVILNGIISFAHYYSCYKNRTSLSFVGFQAVWSTTIPTMGACVAYATCQRCALIVAQLPRARTVFLRTVGVVFALVVIGMTADGIFTLLDAMAETDPPRDALAWYTDRFYAPQMVYVTAVFPLTSIVGSVWALSENMARRRIPPSHMIARLEPPAGSQELSSPSASPAKKSPKHGSAMHVQAAATPESTIPSLAGPNPPPSTASTQWRGRSVSTVASVVSHSTRRMLAVPKVHSARLARSVTAYPLSLPFAVLTGVIVLQWIGFILLNMGLDFGGKIEPFGLTVLLAGSGIAVEMSFERAARVVQRSSHRGANARGVREDQTFDMGGGGGGVSSGGGGSYGGGGPEANLT